MNHSWVYVAFAACLTHCQSAPRTDSTPPLQGPPNQSVSTRSVIARPPQPDPALVAFRKWFLLSEPGEPFISDNVVSNETSLTDPAARLSTLQGGVYIGVGPEQNFSLIAWSHPDLAILLDIRRDNALLHLLYKALFESSASRLEFACGLLGRPFDPAIDLPRDADARKLIERLESIPPTQAWFEGHHQLVVQRIQSYGLALAPSDFERIRHVHQLFFKRQLDLHFELHESSGRTYPPLRQLWTLKNREGHGTFLDSAEAFETVQSMQRQHRIVPIVGDVSAPNPLSPIAERLQQQNLGLRVFYISNVEQYLLGTPGFRGWRDNLKRLPHDEATLVLRTYLDQGRAHPQQQRGQRSTQLLHHLGRFLTKADQREYPSYYDLAVDESLK